MTDKNFQCAGCCNHEVADYSLSIASKGLCISIEYMTKDDLLELKSCIDCMLEDIEDQDDISNEDHERLISISEHAFGPADAESSVAETGETWIEMYDEALKNLAE